MRVRLEQGIIAKVTRSGQLELTSERDGLRYRFGATAAAMWIALQQQGGSPERAAGVLARQWATDPAATRRDVDVWLRDMLRAGLVRVE
ncbi:PqqD family peptide modification chaperone [Micromonospora matsumotoense]|uniref:PqqD family peptide modification chaperone n=1 Tax=Micromonospora matsumotoense TaxID=121616 RepID=UPI0033C18853